MVKKTFKYGKKLKGNTYRRCKGCSNYHYNSKECDQCSSSNKTHYLGKKQTRLRSNDKYRRVCDELGIKRGELQPYFYELFIKDMLTIDRTSKSYNNPENHLKLKILKKKPNNPVINCPICLTDKGNIKTLSCRHQICASCYQTTLNTESLQDACPLCRNPMFSSDNCEDYLMCIKGNTLPKHYSLVKFPIDQFGELFERDRED